MVLILGLVFALELLKKSTLNFNVVDLATINKCWVILLVMVLVLVKLLMYF